MSIKSYAQAIKDVIAEEMRRDGKVFIMGEDSRASGAEMRRPIPNLWKRCSCIFLV